MRSRRSRTGARGASALLADKSRSRHEVSQSKSQTGGALAPHTSFSLSVHLGQAGRREEALAASEEAVAAYRELAGNNMAAYGPDLARSLNNLSIRLGEAGRHDEALAAIEEAAAIKAKQPHL